MVHRRCLEMPSLVVKRTKDSITQALGLSKLCITAACGVVKHGQARCSKEHGSHSCKHTPSALSASYSQQAEACHLGGPTPCQSTACNVKAEESVGDEGVDAMLSRVRQGRAIQDLRLPGNGYLHVPLRYSCIFMVPWYSYCNIHPCTVSNAH